MKLNFEKLTNQKFLLSYIPTLVTIDCGFQFTMTITTLWKLANITLLHGISRILPTKIFSHAV